MKQNAKICTRIHETIGVTCGRFHLRNVCAHKNSSSLSKMRLTLNSTILRISLFSYIKPKQKKTHDSRLNSIGSVRLYCLPIAKNQCVQWILLARVEKNESRISEHTEWGWMDGYIYSNEIHISFIKYFIQLKNNSSSSSGCNNSIWHFVWNWFGFWMCDDLKSKYYS